MTPPVDLGAEADQAEDGTIEISAGGDIRGEAPWERRRRPGEAARRLRHGAAPDPWPGEGETSRAAALGVRPIDIHLQGSCAHLGAKVRIEHGYVVCEAPPGGFAEGASSSARPTGRASSARRTW